MSFDFEENFQLMTTLVRLTSVGKISTFLTSFYVPKGQQNIYVKISFSLKIEPSQNGQSE